MQNIEWDNVYNNGKKFRVMNMLLLRNILNAVGANQGDKALDIGCGTGDLAKKLAANGYKVTAIDSSSTAIEIARTHITDSNIAFMHLDASSQSAFEALGRKFDLITCKLVFAYINDQVGFLSILKTLLKPTGALVIIAPVRVKGTSSTSRYQNISTDKNELEKMLEANFTSITKFHSDYIGEDELTITYILRN